MESQYEKFKTFFKDNELQKLGLMTSWAWQSDPKRLAFTVSRYKFVSKMLANYKNILEVGCGDGFGARVVADEENTLTCIDLDTDLLDSAKSTVNFSGVDIRFVEHDILKSPVTGDFDAAYSLDVLEHIDQEKEDIFLENITSSLGTSGMFVVGIPSLESQVFASELSKLGHVNCKTQANLNETMKRHFRHVLMFSMNDEVVHTGFSKMSHYNIAVGIS